MSCSDTFAEPMLDTEEYLNEYLEQLVELGEEGLLPELDEELEYKVYSIKGSGFGAHQSIVLTTDDEHFVTVELDFRVIDGVKRIYPATQSLPKSLKPNMQYLGNITATGHYLIAQAIAVMRHFGSYFKVSNNCQHYCNKYAAAIGLEGAQSLTDSDKVAITVLAVTLLALLIARVIR